MSVQRFEDERWRTTPQTPQFRHTEARKLVHDGTVLDIGCGDGLFLKMLKEKGITGEGLDVSPEAVAQCKRAGLAASVYSVDEPLPFPDGAFDTVVLLDVLEHVYFPERLLAEAARVARKSVIISVPNFSSLPARLQVLRGKVPENNRPNKAHVYWFNHSVLMRVAEQARLAIRELRMNTFSPFSKLGVPPSVWPNGLALSFVARLEK